MASPPSRIIVLRRAFRFRKAEWRLPTTRRTLDPIDVSPYILDVFRGHELNLPPGLEPATLTGPRASFGFLSVRDGTELWLDGDACVKAIGMPHRATHQIAILRPWQVVRVLVNGRYDTQTERYYSLHDYHFTLCEGEAPEAFSVAKTVNLEAALG